MMNKRFNRFINGIAEEQGLVVEIDFDIHE
jgi:hypothetical protein